MYYYIESALVGV